MPLPAGIPPQSQVANAAFYMRGIAGELDVLVAQYTSEFDYIGSPEAFYAAKDLCAGLAAIFVQFMLVDVAYYPLSPVTWIFFPFDP